jgi:glycosyltransferase involved in cell wall biosynthesis
MEYDLNNARKSPKVSVVIACHNGEKFVSQAIHSVLDQTYTEIECIVVDDASTDNSREVVQNIAGRDSRVVLLSLESNLGPSGARNRAIDLATGDFIALLDADDTYDRERLERLMKLARETNADIVVDNQSVRFFGEDVHKFKAFDFMRKDRPLYFSQEVFLKYSTRVLCFDVGYMKPIFSTDFLRKHNLKYDENLRLAEDFEFYVRAIQYDPRFYGIDYCGYNYYIRPGSLSNSAANERTAVARMSDDIIENMRTKLRGKSIQYLQNRKNVFLKMDLWRRLNSDSNVGFKKYIELLRDPDLLFLVSKNSLLRRTRNRA